MCLVPNMAFVVCFIHPFELRMWVRGCGSWAWETKRSEDRMRMEEEEEENGME